MTPDEFVTRMLAVYEAANNPHKSRKLIEAWNGVGEVALYRAVIVRWLAEKTQPWSEARDR